MSKERTVSWGDEEDTTLHVVEAERISEESADVLDESGEVSSDPSEEDEILELPIPELHLYKIQAKNLKLNQLQEELTRPIKEEYNRKFRVALQKELSENEKFQGCLKDRNKAVNDLLRHLYEDLPEDYAVENLDMEYETAKLVRAPGKERLFLDEG